MSLDCYRCNEPLSKEEVQRWQSFGLCDDCTLNNRLAARIAHGNKAAIQSYWTQPPHEQHRLRLLFGEIQLVVTLVQSEGAI